MNSRALSAILYEIKRRPGFGLNRGKTTEKAFRVVGTLCVILALTAFPDLLAFAQDSSSRQLERVEVEPSTPRTPPRALRSDEGAGYRDPLPDDAAFDAESRRGESAAGSVMPSLSVVTGKSDLSMTSVALPSLVNVVPRPEIERLDVKNYSDLFKKVPGMRSNSYGQGEIGHEIQIRGNAGSHGKDVCVYIDGAPQNFPCPTTAQSDFSWLAPEMIERIEVIKGPFSALYGNFAQAGVINIITKNSDPSPSLALSGGSFGNFRGVGIISADSWYPTPFLVNEYQTIHGYRDNSQIKRFSTFNKGTIPLCGGNLSLRFNYYSSDWGRPGYISLDLVKRGIISRRFAISTVDGGNQGRWSVVFNYAPVDMGEGLYATLFVDHYTFNNYSTNMGASTQSHTHGDRTFWGGRVFYNLVFGDVASAAVGVESRYDSGVAQRFQCVKRNRISTQRDYGLGLLNRSWFVQAQLKPTETLKFVGGLRGDYFENDIENRTNPANSGKGYPSIISPKLGLVITPVKNVNIFGNKGLGFRSPTAEEMSPTSGRKNFELEVAKTDSWDMGFNATLFNCIYLAVDYYQTEMENEVATVDNQPINIGNSMRKGYEVEGTFYASKQINLFASYGWVDAKVKNPNNPGQTQVTFVSEHIIKGGLEFTFDLTRETKLMGDAYYEYLSGVPLYFGTDPKTQYAPDFDAYNFRLATEGTHWGLFFAARYQPRIYSSDIMTTRDNAFAFNPLPLWDLSAGLNYRL